MGRPGTAIQGRIVTCCCSGPSCAGSIRINTGGCCLPRTAVALILCHLWTIVLLETTNDEIESPAARGHAKGRYRCSE